MSPSSTPYSTDSTDVYQDDDYVPCALLLSGINWMINTNENRSLAASWQWTIPLGIFLITEIYGIVTLDRPL
jgi:hypothetical protein